MNNDEIRESILQVVQSATGVILDQSTVRATGRLDDCLGLDSITSMSIVVGLEKRFGFLFDPEELTMDRIGDLAWLVDRIQHRTRGT